MVLHISGSFLPIIGYAMSILLGKAIYLIVTCNITKQIVKNGLEKAVAGILSEDYRPGEIL